MQERSDDELANARGNIVEEIQHLNDAVSRARTDRNRREQRQLELRRDLKRQGLQAIDMEFSRRGVKPRNE